MEINNDSHPFIQFFIKEKFLADPLIPFSITKDCSKQTEEKMNNVIQYKK